MRAFISKAHLFLTTFLILLLGYTSTIGAARNRHEAIVEAFGGAQAREIEARLRIAKKIPHLLSTEFYSKDTATRTRIAQRYWRDEIMPDARYLDPDYIHELRRKFFKAAHA